MLTKESMVGRNLKQYLLNLEKYAQNSRSDVVQAAQVSLF